jgi:hypothetical protein
MATSLTLVNGTSWTVQVKLHDRQMVRALSKCNTQSLGTPYSLLNVAHRVVIGYDCGTFVCMISYFIMNDCLPVFNPGDMEVMRKRIKLMIMKKSCGMIEDPVSTLIITRQNHCDDHMLLY